MGCGSDVGYFEGAELSNIKLLVLDEHISTRMVAGVERRGASRGSSPPIYNCGGGFLFYKCEFSYGN